MEDWERAQREACSSLWDSMTDSMRRQYERQVARANAVEFDGVNNHIWTKGVVLDRGVYTEMFFGSSRNIANCMNAFNRTLRNLYGSSGRLIDTTAVQLANGTCMYVTFEIT